MEIINHDGFFGYAKNTSFDFFGADNLEQYLKNLKKMPVTWEYKDKKISYDYNNLGHRSKNIDEINLNDYILFTGCSNTAGIGLALEDTYSYIVSKRLNIDYYNLALGGTGDDVLLNNILIWFSKIKQKPKYIIIQLSSLTRACYLKDSKIHPMIGSTGVWSEEQSIIDFFVLGSQFGYFEARRFILRNIINNFLSDIPIIILNLEDFNHNRGCPLDLARDLKHPGKISNIKLAEYIIDIL